MMSENEKDKPHRKVKNGWNYKKNTIEKLNKK